jgi:hypothetical protein
MTDPLELLQAYLQLVCADEAEIARLRAEIAPALAALLRRIERQCARPPDKTVVYR